jgi:hypothetical protein
LTPGVEAHLDELPFPEYLPAPGSNVMATSGVVPMFVHAAYQIYLRQSGMARELAVVDANRRRFCVVHPRGVRRFITADAVPIPSSSE